MLQRKQARTAQRSAMKIHSIPAWLVKREFAGSFDLGGANYKFTFAPSKAEIADGKLQLTGRVTVTDPQGHPRVRDGVRARLAATQGAVFGAPPVRPELTEVAAKRATAQATQGQTLPVTESTGPLSFTGVMYLHLDSLDGRLLGVNADLGRVQLNARLAPTDETALRLHGAYSAIVEALHGEQP
ncbi:MAG TPA: hypothetical protein VNO70_15865, partial [Blastocatellia bacterium]|nr:hypothetical protein [Blastocatellia bacterium]